MQSLNGKHLIEFGDFRLDPDKNVLSRDGKMVSLPLKAVELLTVLVENRGEVVTKEELMDRVWANSFVEDSVLTQNVYLLRKTLNTGGAANFIKTVPRRGYLFEGSVREAANGSGTILERHVFEKISLDVEEEKRTQGVEKRKSFYPLLISSFALLLIIAPGVYLYFREDGSRSASAGPPLKLKPVSIASGYKSLAVLPVKSTDEQSGASFSRDLSIRLGSMNKLSVIPADLVTEYAKHGADLKVNYTLSGELQIGSNKFSAIVRLTDVGTETEIWSERFEFDNPLQLQDAVANKTAKEIMARYTPEESAAISKRLPSNLAAYENFQTAHTLWRKRADALTHARKAVELDQSFAPGYALLANIVATGGMKGSKEAKEAEDMLQRAFSLDENLADAYAVQGFMRIFHHYDWEGAEASLKNALDLDGNNVNAHHWLGVHYSIHRRIDDAKREMHLALDLDPTNPTLLADIGQLYYFSREMEKSAEYIQRALTIDPGHPFASSYQTLLFEGSNFDDTKAALQSLERGVNENQFALPYINVDPKYDAIRNDPQFRAILRKMNL